MFFLDSTKTLIGLISRQEEALRQTSREVMPLNWASWEGKGTVHLKLKRSKKEENEPGSNSIHYSVATVSLSAELNLRYYIGIMIHLVYQCLLFVGLYCNKVLIHSVFSEQGQASLISSL